jgi:type VI protein secretion system component Hcp
LIAAAGNGAPIPTVWIYVQKASTSGSRLTYFKLELSPVSVIDDEISIEGNDAAQESLTMAYGKLVESYTQQLPDGTTAKPVVNGWNALNSIPITAFDEAPVVG